MAGKTGRGKQPQKKIRRKPNLSPAKTAAKNNDKDCQPSSKKPKTEEGNNGNGKGKETGVIKSPLDTKDYLAVQFDNGLKALVISTLSHELDVDEDEDEGRMNPKTGVFCKVEKFNRKFVHIPEEGAKPKQSKSRGDCANNSDNEDESWEPEIKPGIVTKKPKVSLLGKPGFKDMAFVCVTVGAGCVHDPDKYHGMAHICEHACASFGSAKFPTTNLMAEVSAVGGMINAMTSQQTTCYVFIVDLKHIGKERFERLLNVLSDSIENPIISKERLAQEVKAVDCECGLREANDVSRLWMIICSTAEPNHPFSRFGCGNSETLADDELHKTLLEWKERHYAANYMSVSVKAPLPVQELKEMVRKYFSPMKSSSKPSPRDEMIANHNNPFCTKEFTKIYKVVPVKQQYQLMTLTWVLDPKFANNCKTQPFAYLGSFFSSGSNFMDYLQRKHWAYDIMASNPFGSERNPLCSTFCLLFRLTDAGVREYEGIIKAVFSYLKMLVDVGPQEDIFNDLRRERADAFHYGERVLLSEPKQLNLCELVGLTSTLGDLNLNDLKFILTTRTLITKFDSKIIDECTKGLTPKNLNVMISSHSFEDNSNLTQTERWHGTKYSKETLRQGLIRDCENIKKSDYKEFSLPKPNPFRQRDISCAARECLLEPQPLETNKVEGIYFKVDLCLNGRLPEGLYHVAVASPLTPPSLISCTLLEVWLMMMRNNLRTELYQAYRAGIMTKAAIMPTCTNTFNMIVDGPPARHGDILKSMVGTFRDFNAKTDPQGFEDQKELVVKFIKDMTVDPGLYAEDLLNFTLRLDHRLLDQLVSEIQTVTVEGFDNFITSFKSRMFVEMVLVGCIPEESAKAAGKMIDSLEYGEVPEILPKDLQRAMLLPLGERCLRVKSRNPCDPTSRVINHYQMGNVPFDCAVIFALLISYPAFVRLRTEEQLSYCVQVRPEQYCGCVGVSIIVAPQPQFHTTGYVDERIDQFLMDFRNEFDTNPELQQLGELGIDQFFGEVFLPGGERFRKLSVQVMAPLNVKEEDGCPNGHNNAPDPKQPTKLKEKMEKNAKQIVSGWASRGAQHVARSRCGGLDLGIDVPDDYKGWNGYFINDLVSFKNALPSLGRSAY